MAGERANVGSPDARMAGRGGTETLSTAPRPAGVRSRGLAPASPGRCPSASRCPGQGGELLPEQQRVILAAVLRIDVAHVGQVDALQDRKSTRLNSSHVEISYA